MIRRRNSEDNPDILAKFYLIVIDVSASLLKETCLGGGTAVENFFSYGMDSSLFLSIARISKVYSVPAKRLRICFSFRFDFSIKREFLFAF